MKGQTKSIDQIKCTYNAYMFDWAHFDEIYTTSIWILPFLFLGYKNYWRIEEKEKLET